MKKYKDLFLKSVILIFIMITVMVNFDTSLVSTVQASGFDDWSFTIEGTEKVKGAKGEVTGGTDVHQNQINISDGDKGYLGLDSTKSKGSTWNFLLNRYKILIVGISGLATLTLVLIAIFLFTKLSADAANPQARSQTIKWIGCLMIAAGLLGSVTLIFSYSYGVFR